MKEDVDVDEGLEQVEVVSLGPTTVYAVGGYNDNNVDRCSNSVEKFETTSNEWTVVAPMNTKRSGCRVAAIGGLLYALGGASENIETQNSMECYDPSTNA